MKKRFLLAFSLSTVLVAPLSAVAAPNRSRQSALLGYYDKLPGKHFAGFEGVNRRSLLKRKGAVVDYKRDYIEIPGRLAPKTATCACCKSPCFPTGKSRGLP